jgi:hypothetical protein
MGGSEFGLRIQVNENKGIAEKWLIQWYVLVSFSIDRNQVFVYVSSQHTFKILLPCFMRITVIIVIWRYTSSTGINPNLNKTKGGHNG